MCTEYQSSVQPTLPSCTNPLRQLGPKQLCAYVPMHLCSCRPSHLCILDPAITIFSFFFFFIFVVHPTAIDFDCCSRHCLLDAFLLMIFFPIPCFVSFPSLNGGVDVKLVRPNVAYYCLKNKTTIGNKI